MNTLHPSHYRPGIAPMEEPLYVVTAVSNPCRYRSRYNLYRAFEKRVCDAGAILHTVEMAYGHRPFEVTHAGDPRNVQVRCTDELWHKENLLNIGIGRLPAEAKYIAIVDADMLFARPDWAQETVQQLQHHPVVQMYSQINHLSADEEVAGSGRSFVAAWKDGEALRTQRGAAQSVLRFTPRNLVADYPDGCSSGSGNLGSPGGAWAFRREALDALGGLIDYSVIGSADYYMAAALFGMLHLVLKDGYHPAFTEHLHQWEARAERGIRRNVGLVPGLMLHHWHGSLNNRGYGERWKLLIDHQFNPHTDLRHDSQGVLHLVDDGSHRAILLRDELRAYFRSRDEDAAQ